MKNCLIKMVSALALMTLTQAGFAETYKAEYRLSSVLAAPFSWGKSAERWAELINKDTQGRIKIKIYNGGSLTGGDNTKEFSALRQGSIDLAIGTAQNWTSQIKELNLFSVPFLMPDYKAVDTILQGEIGTELFRLISAKDVVPIAWGENGYRELSNSKHPIVKPDDLRSLKIRISASPTIIDSFVALGANPTQMSWSDLQVSLATGALDGQENPLELISIARMPSLGQKHITIWGHVYDPLIFAVNKEAWNSWTEADRKAVRQAGLQAAREQVLQAREGTSPNSAIVKNLVDSGVTITRLSAVQIESFKQKERGVYDKWSKIIGGDLVKKAEAAGKAQ
ncbi:MAG TPA: DctP family TRAP transporter solute-binding subunit [Burkholderiaceae bacterium]|jgi:tripartite ATP-independent transporter DctP family solute receptor|nr:DctP family TRAP transporter solute-binding subunit [Burkholderiaceae bacterium]